MNFTDLHKLRPFYLDRELGAEELAQFEAHLRDCDECRTACAKERALSVNLKRELRHYRAPLELRDRVRRDLAAKTERPVTQLRYLARGWNPIALAASLLLAIATSSALTTAYLTPSEDDHVVAEVVSSHVRSLMADHLTDVASSDQHTVKPWFTGKVDAAPPAVDLAAAGFPLVGGRLDYVDAKPCAALVYRHDKHVINVLVWADRDGGEKLPESYERQGYNLVHFTEDGLDFWAVSDLERGELKDFADRLMQSAAPSHTEL